jgi:hypothetical protein
MKKTLLSLSLLAAAFSYGQVTIGSGTNLDTNFGLDTPISVGYGYSLSQFIYLASEINASGTITGIQLTLDAPDALTNSDDMIDIWVGHTSNSSYNPTNGNPGWIPVSAQTQVLVSGSLVQDGSSVTITFTTPFVYNGTDNLVFTVDANEPGYDNLGGQFYQTAASANVVSLMVRDDNNNPSPSNPPTEYSGSPNQSSAQAKYTRPIITLLGITNLGVTENTAALFSISPNPTDAELNINTSEEVATAKFYNTLGQQVKFINVENNRIDVSDLRSGAYGLQLVFKDGKTVTRKVLKK